MTTELQRQKRLAVAERVKRVMGAVETDQGENLFSCVFVRVRDRFFAITASHCIQRTKDFNSLLIATMSTGGKTIKPAECFSISFDRLPGERAPSFDLAAIEIVEEQAKMLDVEFFDPTASLVPLPTPGTSVCLAGFPTDRATRNERKRELIDRGGQVLFSAVSSRPLPEYQDGNPYNPDVDVLIEYKQDQASDGAGKPVTTKPDGLSGCGVFTLPPDTGAGIWSANDIALVAIQASAYTSAGLLRAKRVDYVAALIESLDSNDDTVAT